MSELKYTVGQMNNIMSSSLEYFTNWKEAEKENKRLTARIAELEAALSWKPKMNGFPRMESDERW